jgi:hypothetical protein
VQFVVSDYYYNHKREPSRKEHLRGKERKLIQVMRLLKGIIKWKLGPYLKDNAIQASSTLSAFVGVNIMSVHEVA